MEEQETLNEKTEFSSKEIVETRYKFLIKTLKQLNYTIIRFNSVCNKTNFSIEDDDYILYRDALLNRFEVSYYLSWKFLKKYLEEEYGILVVSPSKVFHACLEQKITTIDETKKLLEMINTRNNASHLCSEEMANEIAKLIPDYYQLMATIISRIKIE